MFKKYRKYLVFILPIVTLVLGLVGGVVWQSRQQDLITVVSKTQTEPNYFESKLSNGWLYYRGTAEQIDKKILYVRTDKNLLEVLITPHTRVATSSFPPKVTERFVWGNYNNIHHYDLIDVLAVKNSVGQLEASSILVWTNLRKQQEVLK